MALSIKRSMWFCGTMLSIRNISICSLFLFAFFVIIKNTALLTSLYQKSGSNNSKTPQKRGFVYSLRMCLLAHSFYFEIKWL